MIWLSQTLIDFIRLNLRIWYYYVYTYTHIITIYIIYITKILEVNVVCMSWVLRASCSALVQCRGDLVPGRAKEHGSMVIRKHLRICRQGTSQQGRTRELFLCPCQQIFLAGSCVTWLISQDDLKNGLPENSLRSVQDLSQLWEKDLRRIWSCARIPVSHSFVWNAHVSWESVGCSWPALLLFVMIVFIKAGWGYVGRRASASPATGYPKLHNAEQEALVKAPAVSCSIASADDSCLILFEGFALQCHYSTCFILFQCTWNGSCCGLPRKNGVTINKLYWHLKVMCHTLMAHMFIRLEVHELVSSKIDEVQNITRAFYKEYLKQVALWTLHMNAYIYILNYIDVRRPKELGKNWAQSCNMCNVIGMSCASCEVAMWSFSRKPSLDMTTKAGQCSGHLPYSATKPRWKPRPQQRSSCFSEQKTRNK